eukprot:gene8052-1286_t
MAAVRKEMDAVVGNMAFEKSMMPPPQLPMGKGKGLLESGARLSDAQVGNPSQAKSPKPPPVDIVHEARAHYLRKAKSQGNPSQAKPPPVDIAHEAADHFIHKAQASPRLGAEEQLSPTHTWSPTSDDSSAKVVLKSSQVKLLQAVPYYSMKQAQKETVQISGGAFLKPSMSEGGSNHPLPHTSEPLQFAGTGATSRQRSTLEELPFVGSLQRKSTFTEEGTGAVSYRRSTLDDPLASSQQLLLLPLQQRSLLSNGGRNSNNKDTAEYSGSRSGRLDGDSSETDRPSRQSPLMEADLGQGIATKKGQCGSKASDSIANPYLSFLREETAKSSPQYMVVSSRSGIVPRMSSSCVKVKEALETAKEQLAAACRLALLRRRSNHNSIPSNSSEVGRSSRLSGQRGGGYSIGTSEVTSLEDEFNEFGRENTRWSTFQSGLKRVSTMLSNASGVFSDLPWRLSTSTRQISSTIQSPAVRNSQRKCSSVTQPVLDSPTDGQRVNCSSPVLESPEDAGKRPSIWW